MDDDLILRFDKLRLSFVHRSFTLQALRGVSLGVRRGEILAVAGESGCGKSVLLKAVLSLNPQRAHLDGGRILYRRKSPDGRLMLEEDLTALPPHALRALRGREIGTVFQDSLSSLNPALTIGEQLSAQCRRALGLSRTAAKERALYLLRLLELPDPEARFSMFSYQLSGGQRQRCALALALAGKPALLLADEITTALDVTVQAHLMQLMLRLKEEYGLSILWVTHDLCAAAAIADRIAVMYAGRLVEVGLTEEIFHDARHPYTKALLKAQPALAVRGEPLPELPGQPPVLINPPEGDLFAPRSKEALEIDYVLTPPFYAVSSTHAAATWLLHPKVCGRTYPKAEDL